MFRKAVSTSTLNILESTHRSLDSKMTFSEKLDMDSESAQKTGKETLTTFVSLLDAPDSQIIGRSELFRRLNLFI